VDIKSPSSKVQEKVLHFGLVLCKKNDRIAKGYSNFSLHRVIWQQMKNDFDSNYADRSFIET
jgi:hypothetical protein